MVALDPCRSDPAWGETAGGAVLLALLGPVVGVVGSRLGARLADGPSERPGPLVWLVLVLAGGVAVGAAVVAAQTLAHRLLGSRRRPLLELHQMTTDGPPDDPSPYPAHRRLGATGPCR